MDIFSSNLWINRNINLSYTRNHLSLGHVTSSELVFKNVPKFTQIPYWWCHTGRRVNFWTIGHFELSGQFCIRIHLLVLCLKWSLRIFIHLSVGIILWKYDWNSALGHHDVIGQITLPIPEFAFLEGAQNCQLWKYAKKPKINIFWWVFFCSFDNELLFPMRQ